MEQIVTSTSQKYSNIVFSRIQKNLNKGSNDELKQYKSLCKRSGGILRTVGLIQYLAFIMAKSKDKKGQHYEMLLNDLTAEWKELSGNNAIASANDFLDNVRAMMLSDYMQCTRRVLMLLQWHKRVSDILIKGNCESGEDD